MNRYICIHGHFYQPPRENAWLEAIESQDSAYPYHDWNERITAEGYAPNTAARILDHEHRIIDIVNNYARISFNFGPTLLSWIERERPKIYDKIIEGDTESQQRFSGHGSAIAQVYNHMIMPLANRRDKETQIIWGITDFEHRFGRKPEGMWLPETAVDLESLDLLASHNIKFTILSPYQASRVREIDGEEWRDARDGRIDPKMPYVCNLPSGKSINIFFYDGPISQELGFGDLLNSGEAFAERLLGVFSDDEQPQLVHIATDGETYGHHRVHGDMALVYCLHHIESNELAKLTNYAEYLEKYPPSHEIEILENSSWSCIHGIERWRSDCGCNSGRSGWNQAWRGPLRDALDWLRGELIPIYEKGMANLSSDPWQTRNDYVGVILDRSAGNVEDFLKAHASDNLSRENESKTLKLLELQRHAMLMYTSCAWFFDEISGIETTQVMQYATRAIQLAQEVCGKSLESGFAERLEQAPSNINKFKNGRRIYERFLKPAVVDPLRVGGHYAISSFFEEQAESTRVFCYAIESKDYNLVRAGKLRLAVGRIIIRSAITWNESDISFAVLHLGGHILNGGVREFSGEEPYDRMHQQIKQAFQKSDIPEVIRLMDEHFGTHNYSLWHLFRDEQRKVLNQVFAETREKIEVRFREIYENNYTVMQAMQEMDMPLPEALSAPLVFILKTDLKRQLQQEELDFARLESLVAEFQKWHLEPDRSVLSFVAGNRINALMREWAGQPDELSAILTVQELLQLLGKIPLEIDLWEAQNICFSVGKKHYAKMVEKDDEAAERWIESFVRLSDSLQVRLD